MVALRLEHIVRDHRTAREIIQIDLGDRKGKLWDCRYRP